jgi:alkylated DNA repair dioxygenase AlkB
MASMTSEPEVRSRNDTHTHDFKTSPAFNTRSRACIEHPDCPGLFFIQSILSESEETELLADMALAPGHIMPHAPHAQEYGWKYSRPVSTIQLTPEYNLGELPGWMTRLWTTCVSRVSMPAEVQAVAHLLPDHGIVNRYKPGGGCAAHVDHKTFWGTWVLGVSLQSGCMLEMRRESEPADSTPLNIWLPARSAYVFTGDSRFKWTHAIAPVLFDTLNGERIERGDRTSVTLRTITSDFKGATLA